MMSDDLHFFLLITMILACLALSVFVNVEIDVLEATEMRLTTAYLDIIQLIIYYNYIITYHGVLRHYTANYMLQLHITCPRSILTYRQTKIML